MTRISARTLQEWMTAYAFLFPVLLGWGIFVFLAMLMSLYFSFTTFNLLNPPQWLGVDNYLRVVRHPDFLRYAVPNTLKYVAVVVPVQTVLSLIFAFALDQKLRARDFFRTAFYLPSVTSSVVIGIIFVWLFAPQGIINQLLGLEINWLNNTRTSLPTIMIVNIWSTTGTLMLIFLAGLQDIPGELYEAAAIDGASRVQMFRYVTVPLLRPVIFFVVTLGIIGTFQVFDQIYIMTKGGPLKSTMTWVYLIYFWGVAGGEAGHGTRLGGRLLAGHHHFRGHHGAAPFH
ncbi:MAG: sugar ABC transporter permease [Ardenticatenia bacterium]|nr:sugar ABC transporter permease [Ardenticatenia bacterium]